MLVLRHPPCVTLFPYTTLFRSRLRLFRCLQTDLGPAAAPDKRTFVAQPRFRQRREHFAIQPLLSPDEMFQPFAVGAIGITGHGHADRRRRYLQLRPRYGAEPSPGPTVSLAMAG